MTQLTSVQIGDLFDVISGDFHATKELEPGSIPLISCGDIENGLVGWFDIPRENQYRRAITVAYNGQPLLSKFHPYTFGAKDDVAVLKPRSSMRTATLLYVAAMLNRNAWRYSYGRKCFREKLKLFRIPVPVQKTDAAVIVDEDKIQAIVSGLPHWNFLKSDD